MKEKQREDKGVKVPRELIESYRKAEKELSKRLSENEKPTNKEKPNGN